MKTKEANKKEQVKAELTEKGIEFILTQFVDIDGCPKVKQVPVDCFDGVVDEALQALLSGAWDSDLKAMT